MGVSILILTRNEASNIGACIDCLGGFDDIVVLDSLSTDRTCAIARSRGARIFERAFDNWAAHQNWAMENIDFRNSWVFYLDADERMRDDLRTEILGIAADTSRCEVAYFCGRRNFFMGRWIRHAMPPGMIMRFFRPERVRFERLVNPVPLIDGPHGYLRCMFDHYNFSKGLSEWIEKHNRYSQAEAIEGMKVLANGNGSIGDFLARDPFRRRAALKDLSFRMPMRPLLKFLWMYLLQRGFLDGHAGYLYCRLQAMYESMIVLKMRELAMRERGEML